MVSSAAFSACFDQLAMDEVVLSLSNLLGIFALHLESITSLIGGALGEIQ